MNKVGNILTILAGVLILTACGSSDSDTDGQPDLPEATGTDVWNYLEEEDYEGTWNMWPGTDELYEGSEPHGMLLTTYLNDIAYDAVMSGDSNMPDGAIIVKENYMPDSTLAAITTMFKVEGYNQDHNDWFWLKNDPEGVIEVEGRVDACQSCHQDASRDYLFTEFPNE